MADHCGTLSQYGVERYDVLTSTCREYLVENDKMKILLLDIETAPAQAFIWDPRTKWVSPDKIISSGHTICFAAKWLGKKEIGFYSVQEHSWEDMIDAAWRLLDLADAIVHYNGSKFDIPTLNREFEKLKLGPPAPAHQIDLYRVVRQNFRMMYNSMAHVCEELGLGEKTAHEKGMALWAKCLAEDPQAWAVMKKYNKQDVVLTERLYNRLLPWIKSHPNHALYADAIRPTCPNCGSVHVEKRGYATTSTGKYQRFQCQGCGKWSRSGARLPSLLQSKEVLR